MDSRTGRWWQRIGRARRQKIRHGASVRLLIDADEYLPAMLSALESAKTQILIENYMIASDETGTPVIDVLCRKARSGVNVCAVFDAVGSRALSTADRERLRASGAHLRVYHRLGLLRLAKTFLRTHRRILVVDSAVGYVGGYGFTDHWTDRSPFGKYHERVWELRGSVLNDLARSFRFGAGKTMSNRVAPLETQAANDDLAYRIFNLSRLGRIGALRRLTRELASSTRSRMWIATGYFVPTLLLRRALCTAAERGIDVRLYLTGPATDHPLVRHAARHRYEQLLRSGVRIFESVERPMHAKCMVVDEGYANLGSANMDRWSIRFNRELNVEIFDPATAYALAVSIEAIEKQSVEITLERWHTRSSRDKILEWCAGFVEGVL